VPVDDASYRPWDGTARPSRLASLAIAGTMIRRLLRNRLLRVLVTYAPIMACVISVVIFGVTYSEEMATVRRAATARGPAGPGGAIAAMISGDTLAQVNRWVFPPLLLLAVVVAAFAGAPLIAEDRRARSLALYFSRPIRHFDYVAGKFLTLAFFLGLFLLAPPICIYLTDCAMSNVDGTAIDHLPTFGRSLVPGVLACLVFGSLAIGASSLVERTNHAVLLFFGVIMLSFFLSQLISRPVLRDPDWLAIAPQTAIMRIHVDLMAIEQERFMSRAHFRALDVGVAWNSVWLWTAAGFGVLVWRIRKVEVVS